MYILRFYSNSYPHKFDEKIKPSGMFIGNDFLATQNLKSAKLFTTEKEAKTAIKDIKCQFDKKRDIICVVEVETKLIPCKVKKEWEKVN